MNRKLLLIGGGGHCKSALDCILQNNQYLEVGIVDKRENMGKNVLGVPIVGCDDDLLDLFHKGFSFAFVTVGSIGNPAIRIKLFSRLEEIGFEIPNIMDCTATVSRNACLSQGIFVGKNAVINAGSVVGKGAIINTSSTIEHDCVIEDFVHIAPGAVLSGEVHVGHNTHIGSNSVVRQRVTIGSDTIIGMGSVALHDIGNSMLAYGNPCREVKAL